MSIVKIHAREIFDSRGNPTVEVDLHTDKGRQLFMHCVCDTKMYLKKCASVTE